MTCEGIGAHSLLRDDGTVTRFESNVRKLDRVVICGLGCLDLAAADRRAVIESDARLRALFDGTQQVMLLAGLDRRVQAFKAVAAQWASAVLGEPLQEGARLDAILEPVGVEAFERLWSRAITGERAFEAVPVSAPEGNIEWFEAIYSPMIADGEIVGVSNTYRWFRSRGKVTERDDRGHPTRLSGTFIDFEEQKSFETRLHRAERLESLGRLAGGIAHDFNNRCCSTLRSTRATP